MKLDPGDKEGLLVDDEYELIGSFEDAVTVHDGSKEIAEICADQIDVFGNQQGTYLVVTTDK